MTAKEKLKTVKYKKETENPPPPSYSENAPYNFFYEELSTVPNSPPLNEFSQVQNQLPAESKSPRSQVIFMKNLLLYQSQCIPQSQYQNPKPIYST